MGKFPDRPTHSLMALWYSTSGSAGRVKVTSADFLTLLGAATAKDAHSSGVPSDILLHLLQTRPKSRGALARYILGIS